MTTEEYVRKARQFLTPEHDNLVYLSEGLIGEIGEVYGVLKQRFSGEVNRTELTLELGDVLWYAVMLDGDDTCMLLRDNEPELTKPVNAVERMFYHLPRTDNDIGLNRSNAVEYAVEFIQLAARS